MAGAVATYFYMLTVTLPHLSALAGGVPVFDLRPGGYDHAAAVSILSALGTAGAQYYEQVQHRWDTAFPILLGVTLVYWTLVAARRWRRHGLPLAGWMVGLLVALTVAETAADLGENLAVAAMLSLVPAEPTVAQVALASTLTLAKSVLSTLAYSSLLILALGPWVAGAAKRLRKTT